MKPGVTLSQATDDPQEVPAGGLPDQPKPPDAARGGIGRVIGFAGAWTLTGTLKTMLYDVIRSIRW
jgi:hypothetical protein